MKKSENKTTETDPKSNAKSNAKDTKSKLENSSKSTPKTTKKRRPSGEGMVRKRPDGMWEPTCLMNASVCAKHEFSIGFLM